MTASTMTNKHPAQQDDDDGSEQLAASIEAPDDGAAGQEHLDAGRPIYYCEDSYPDELVRKWPDSQRELVKLDLDGRIVAIGTYDKPPNRT